MNKLKICMFVLPLFLVLALHGRVDKMHLELSINSSPFNENSIIGKSGFYPSNLSLESKTSSFTRLKNLNKGTFFTTIQDAINAASSGDVILVPAGTYTENLVLTQPLDIRGPNYGINPSDASWAQNVLRVPEAILKGTITGTASGFTFNGFTIEAQAAPALIALSGGSGGTINTRNNIFDGAGLGTLAYSTGQDVTHKIQNNVFKNFTNGSGFVLSMDGSALTNSEYTGNLFSGNTRWSMIIHGSVLTPQMISGNNFASGPLGISLGSGGHTVSNNIFSNAGGAIYSIGSNNQITGNVFTNTGYAFSQDGGSGNVVTNNDLLGMNGSGFSLVNGVTSPILASCNYWGSADYTNIVSKVSGKAIYTPYRTTSISVISDCLLNPSIPANLNLTYNPSNQDILVEFDVAQNDLELKPIPGADLAAVTILYNTLAAEIPVGNPTTIQSAALNIGDDVIVEYYYMNGLTKTYLQTAGSQPLVKNKYWDKYLVRDTDNLRFPDWTVPQTLVESGRNFRTHTNPGTGAVSPGWLNPVLGKNLIVKVTFLYNGAVNSIEKSIAIDAGPIKIFETGLGYPTIQEAIDAATTGQTVVVAAGIYTYPLPIELYNGIKLTGAGSGIDPMSSTILVAPSSCSPIGVNITGNGSTLSKMRISSFNIAVQLSSTNNAKLDDLALVDFCLYGVRLAGSLNSGVQILNTNISRTVYLAGTVGLRAGTADGVNGLTINGCTISGLMQGITTFQNSPPSLFTNIQIINSNISNNTQKGLYFEKLDNALLSNLIMDSNGTDTNYGFNNGIDINLKYGVYQNITISNSDIINSGYAIAGPFNPENPAALTIKARDDADSYDDIPATLSGVFILNNRISGPHNGIRIGEFGKINNTPALVSITGNDLSFPFANKAIVKRINGNINLDCNWHGTTDLATINSKLASTGSGIINLGMVRSNGTDGSAGPGFQPTDPCICPNSNLVTNTNTSETFCTIQEAIDDAQTLNGHVITVGAGTYAENLTFTKSLTLLGANSVISPNLSGSRVPESIIMPLAGRAVTGNAASISVTIKGFTFDQTNSQGTDGHFVYQIGKANTTWNFEKNIFQKAGENSTAGNWYISGSTGLDLTMTDNLVQDNLASNGISIWGSTPFTLDVQNNVWEDNGAYAFNLNGGSGIIKGNIFRETRSVTLGGPGYFWYNYQGGILMSDPGFNLNIKENEFYNTHSGVILYADVDGPINIENNLFNGNYEHSIRASNAEATLGSDLNDVIVTNNSFINYQGVGKNLSNARVDNALLTTTCNWFGYSNPILVQGQVSANVDVVPFLTNGTDNSGFIGFQPTPNSCNGGPVKLYTDNGLGTLLSAYPTIQAAVDAASNGNAIVADAGTYIENVVVNKEVSITGAGIGLTTVYPAISDPNCGGAGGGSLCAGSSNVFLVEGNNVTISGLTVDGNNTSLTGGFLSNGVDVDARNGIITNHAAGVFNNLVVNAVEVKNIYLRGIYASSGGSFTFSNNTLDNVDGEAGSIAIFNFGGAGTFTGNMVSNANDGIASNWSKGSVYSGNTVTLSGSGIHTDNNGGSGGIADIIQNNNVTNSSTNGYGIWVFAPYRDVQVLDNTVTNVDVGLTNAGQNAAVTVSFLRNIVDGMNKPASTGVYQTTSLFGFGTSDVTGIYSNNFIRNNADAFNLEYETDEANTMTVNDNSITGNPNGVVLSPLGGTLAENFQCNWWGSASSGAVDVAAANSTNYSPWLTLGTDSSVNLGFQPTMGSCNGTPVEIISAIVDPISCGETTGSIAVTFSGGTTNYSVAWTGPSSNSASGIAMSSYTMTGLVAGMYNFTITDANGSTATGSATVEYLPVTNVTDMPNTHYASIQAAIDASSTGTGDVIEVCQGTYMESVVINKSIHLKGLNVNNTFIMAPASLPAAPNPESFLVKIAGPTVLAEISGLTLKGPSPVVGIGISYGILVRDQANANIHDNIILDIRDNPFSGNQYGIGIQVGRQSLSTTGIATITNNIIQGYQKNGITVDGLGSSATINGNTITGAGTTPTIAQNGLQVSRGATASVIDNTISGNSFHLMGNPSDWGSTGILLFQSGQVTLAGGNNLSGNDQNYYAYQPTGTLVLGAEIFGSSTAPLGFGNQIVNVSNQNLDLRASTFNGELASAMSMTELFDLEDFIFHKIDGENYGFVYVKTDNTFITPLSFETGSAQIQRGIDAASDGFTVNVRSGNYAKQIAPNKSIFGVGSYQFGLSVDKNNLTLKGYKAGDVPVVSAMEAAVSFTTGATNNFGASGIFVQGNGVTIEGLKVGNNLNTSDIKDNNKTFEIIGDGFTMTKNWITPDSDEGTIYMGRWDLTHPISTYSISNNKLENTLISINNGVGIGGLASRLIQNNEFTGTATPYLIGFRGWYGANPVQGWIVDPVGGATVTGNNFASTGVVNYVQARGNAGGYVDSELDWSAIWTMNTYGNKVITLQDEGTFDPRTYDAGGYTDSRRITPFIQENVNIGATSDVILVGSGTYPESVGIATNGLSLKGVGVDKTQVVINGTGLTGPLNGITLNSGITGTAISNLTIKNFTGAGGNTNAGIYGVLQNSMTSINNVAVQDNPNGSGIYLNGLGGINNVSITNSMISGHTPGARGITIWNGFKQNITITNNMVSNNNCCGIELQDGTASAVNISGNTIDIGIGDNAIAALGLNPSTGVNSVSNNIITGGGRFGIEIKNPNGGVTVSGNNVSLTTQNADLRDRAGIAIIRRDFTSGNPAGYVDIPNGVTVTGNTITGYQQTSGEEGFGIVIEGTGHSVSANTLTGNEVGIQLQGGGHANPNYIANNAGSGEQAVGQSPNYFGRGNAPIVCSVDLGTNTFSGNGTNVRLVTGEETSTDEMYIADRVEGSIKNLDLMTFHCTIQEAVDNAVAGNTIQILSADYTEPSQVIINKNLILEGQGIGSTILRFGINTAPGGHANDLSAWIVSEANTNFTLRDLTIDGTGKSVYTAVRFKSNGLVDQVAFNEIKYAGQPYLGYAVQVLNGDVDVSNSTFTNIGRIGVHYRNGVIPGANVSGTYSDNTYVGKGLGDWLDYALDISGGTQIDVLNSDISNNKGTAISDGSTSAGILVTSYFPTPANSQANNVLITGSDIYNNTTGIAVGFDALDVSFVNAHNNNIYGNGTGVSSTKPLVDASSNWWGNASGPSGAGPGTGDAVTTFVDYCPWLNAAYPIGIATTNIQNGNTLVYYCTIQEAIDAATPGDMILVGAGNFTEEITINKDINLKGANTGTAGMNVRVAESVLLNSKITINGANTVIVDGFKLLRNDNWVGDMVQVGGNSTSSIINNIVERNGITGGLIVRAISISNGPGTKTISDNVFTGDVSGGLFGTHKTWNSIMYINGPTGTVNVINNKLTNSRSGLNIDDYHAGVNMSGNTFENNGTHISLGGTAPTTGSFMMGANDFKTPGSAIINLSNVDPSFRLDITSSSYNGVNFASLPLATRFEVEARMFHKERTVDKKGKVVYVANNQYVNNFTLPVTKIDIIQNSIKYADANDVINLEDGTYNQGVVIDKSNLTLQGALTDKTLNIINGTGSGSTSGIKINNAITNISIKNLTVQNFAGSNGNSDAGIYAIGGNNNLLVDSVALTNNANGSGFYANGPVDGITINGSMVSGHTFGARGIVIWNGFKQNITITNNMVSNNNCCGIELQDGTASAVNISGNTIDIGIGDNAIAALGLNPATGLNTISNNIITGGGRFGIEIKNPNGGVTVSGNNVSLTTQNVDERDRAGIAIIRRDFTLGNPDGYTDIPNGVTVTGNSITGYQQSSGDEGYGIVIEGTGHSVSGNTLTGNEVGIQLQGGGHANPNYVANNAGSGDQAVGQSPNYFGRGNAPFICAVSLGANTFSSNGTNVRLVTANETSTNAGYITSKVQGSIHNVTQNTFHCTIQDAIDNSNGTIGTPDIIMVPSGLYKEEIVVTKNNFELHGANYGVTACSTRVSESVIMAPRSDPDPNSLNGVYLFYLDSNLSNIVIDGFAFDGDNPDFTSAVNFGGANIDAVEAISAYSGVTNVIVKNNIIQNLNYAGIDFYNYYNGGAATAGNLISNNKFHNIQPATFGLAVLIYNNAYTDITENCMTDVNVGIQTGNFSNAKPGGGVNTISDNTIASNNIGIWHNLAYNNAQKFEIKNNELSSSNPATNNGIKITSIQGTVEVLVENNTIGAANEGIEIWNTPTSVPVIISGGTITNANTGIFVNNFEGYNSNGGNVNVSISGVTINGGGTGTHGVRVYDNPVNAGASVFNVEVTGNTAITGYANGISVQGEDANINIHDNLSSISSNVNGIVVDGGNAIIVNNTISSNTGNGIEFKNDGTGYAHYNNITSNGSGITNNNASGEIDGTLNWWGSADGPSTVGLGTGDNVSENVLYCPWLDAPVVTPSTGNPIYTIHNDIIALDVTIGANNTALSSTGTISIVQTICSDTEFEVANTVNTSAGSFLKVEITDADNLIGITATTYVLATGFSISNLTLVNTGTANKTFSIVLTPYTESDGDTGLDITDECYGTAVSISITVQPRPIIDATITGPSNTIMATSGNAYVMTICSGEEVSTSDVTSISLDPAACGPLFVQTVYNTTISTLPATQTFNVPVAAATPTTSITPENHDGVAKDIVFVSTPYYDVDLSGTLTAGDVLGGTITFTLTVNPEPTLVDPSDITICSDDPVNVDFMDELIGTQYAWSITNPAVLPSGFSASSMSGNGDIANLIFNNVTNAIQTVTITVIPTSSSPQSCVGASQSFTVTVKPEPLFTAASTTIQACSGAPYSFDLDNYITNNGLDLGQVTYTYTVAKIPNLPLLDPDPVGGSSVDGAISNTITNYGNAAITVRYTVTPTSANGCVGASFIVNVVINPVPQVDIIPNGSEDLCEGGSRIISGTVVPNATYTYAWTIIPSPASVGAFFSNPTSISPTLNVGSSITPGPLTVQFTATNTVTGCSGTETFVFTVYDMPDIMVVNPAVIYACETPAESEFGTFNLTLAVTSYTGATPTFHITASDAQNGIGAIANPSLYFGTDQQTIWARTAAGICYDVASFMLDVLDAPLVDLQISDNTLCQNQGMILISPLPPGGVFSGTASSAVTGNQLNPALLIPGTYSLIYTITGLNGCMNSDSLNIEIFATPVVDAGSYGPVCVDAADITLIGTPLGGTFSGIGVTGNLFDPSVGTQLITYTFTGVNGCSNSANTTITVNQIDSIVTNTTDSDPGSLRAVIGSACPSDNVYFAPALSMQTIGLDSEIPINRNLTIHGLGVLDLTISGSNTNRIFNMGTGGLVTIKDLKLIEAYEVSNGGAIYLQNAGILTLDNVTFENNFEGIAKKALTNESGTTINIVNTVIMNGN